MILGPLFFSLAVRRSLEFFALSLGPQHLVLAYLDNIYVLSPDESALPAAQAHFQAGSSLTLNAIKSVCHPLSDIRTRGFAILGRFLGPTEARATFLRDKLEDLVPLLRPFSKLPCQHALLCLKMSLQQSLRHLPRTLPSADIMPTWKAVDDAVCDEFRRIRVGPSVPDDLADRDGTLISLPLLFGGSGIQSHCALAPLAEKAYTDISLRVLSTLSSNVEVPPDIRSQHELSNEAHNSTLLLLLPQLSLLERTVYLENASPLERRWLIALPTQVFLRLADFEISANLLHRSLIASAYTHWPRCSLPNSFGHHEVCVKTFRSVQVGRHAR